MFAVNIERKTLQNKLYRKILYTDNFQQLVVMSLKPGEDIPVEKHNGSQFFRVESGIGIVVAGKKKRIIKEGVSLIVPKNTQHYVKNTSTTKPLKLYTIYTPPQHLHNDTKK